MSRTSLGQAWRAALELVVVKKPVAKPVGRWAVGDGDGNAFRRADQGSWDNGAVAHRGCGKSRVLAGGEERGVAGATKRARR